MTPADGDAERQRDIRDAIAAAKAGDVAALRGAIERRHALVDGHGDHRPLIELAVREGRLEAVRLLLDAGADPNQRGHFGDTVPQMARDRGHTEIVSLLDAAITRSARTRPSDADTDHQIHRLAEAGDLAGVRRVLDANPALLNQGDRGGATPLQRAIIGRARGVVRLLLDRGADIHVEHPGPEWLRHVRLQAIDFAIWGGYRSVRPARARSLFLGISAFARHLAARAPLRWSPVHDRQIANLLLARGAAYDLPIATALGHLTRVTEMLDADAARIREARPNGQLALSAAVEFGHDRIAHLLLDRGADPTWPDAHGSLRGAALHAAARAGNRPMVELLLARGADPNGFVNASGNSVYAARTREIRALLVAHGGTLDPFDLVWLDEDDEVMRRVTEHPESAKAGCGGVFTAVCTRGKRDLLQRLLDAGIRCDAPAGGCHSYLLEHPDMLRSMLSARALDPDYPTEDGVTLLHDTCMLRASRATPHLRTESAAALLDAGANISARDEEYRSTPLAWTARLNLPDLAAFLLSRGAPTNLPDDEPWATPLAWATRRGHTQIVDMLRTAGAR
jgi:ankyrin repeat protein